MRYFRAILALTLITTFFCQPVSSQFYPIDELPPDYIEFPKIDPLNPRRHVYLDGQWSFRREGEFSWRTANLPASWQVNFPELRGYVGSAEYRRTITIPSEWMGDPWIVFGASNYATRVVVNDRYVGFNEGGYTPFAFNLADVTSPGGTAEITFTVEDSGPNKSVRSYPFQEIPHGKQSWYGNVSGPWQSIHLEERARTHVKNLKITPSVSNSSVKIEVNLSQSPPSGSGNLLATIYSPRVQAPVVRLREDLSSSRDYVLNAHIPGAQLWSPDEPNLYTVNISIVTEQGAVVDQYEDRFGMRSIAAKDGKILLNGKPIFLSGVLDQDFYPETHYSIPSEEFLRNQFETAKKLGINLLRCHVKIPDPMYLRLADEIGLLVWYELPNVGTLTSNSRARLSNLLKEITERDYNHPSLVIISIKNEAWGIDLENPDQRKWLISAFDAAKKMNPTRLIIDNSPCAGNYHLKTDILDFHAYFSMPDNAERMSDWVREFASRPDWLFSPHGDATPKGTEPLILSELGNWGLPSLNSLLECYDGSEPWWFETGTGSLRPAGVEDRFRRIGLNSVFGDYSRLARATQEIQLLAFKYQIEEIRKYPQIAGFVWTEFTDIHWESNGLLDFCRNLKSSARIVPVLSGQRAVFPRVEHHNFYSGQEVVADVHLSNFASSPGAGTRVEWNLDGFPDIKGVIQIDDPMDPPAAILGGKVRFQAPNVTNHRIVRLVLKWVSDSDVKAQNYIDINLFPANLPDISLNYYVDDSITNTDILKRWIVSIGGQIVPALLNADIAITGRLSEEIRAWTSRGGRTILVATSADALDASLPLRVVPRSEKGRGGDWCSSFVWLDKSTAFTGFNSRTQMMDFSFSNFIPRYVIEGMESTGGWDNVESGIFVGWIHEPAAITMRAGDQNSRLMITTFPLTGAVENDPLADLLMRNLIHAISSETFLIRGGWNPFQ